MVSIVEDLNMSEPVRGVPVAERAYVFFHDGTEHCAVTQHRIRNGKLGPGRVVSMRSIGDRFARITGSDKVRLLPENVFISNQRLFAWVTPARYDAMWFSVNGRQWAHNVWWPNLLWIAERDTHRLRVFAVGGSGRPTMETILYHAPVMNIGGSGLLCEGSAQLPRQLDEEHISEIEACVYESNFTHVNHGQTLKGIKGNRGHLAFWRDKEKLKDRVRVAELVSKGRLKEVLR
jgi:PRTRC genetic system protein B